MEQYADPFHIHYDGSLDSIMSRMAADNLLEGHVYNALAEDDEESVTVGQEQAEVVAAYIMIQIEQCQRRDYKWFTLATALVIALLLAVNVPLFYFFPDEHYGSLRNIFSAQIILCGSLFVSTRITRLYGTFASLFVFFQCFILMVSKNKLRRALLDEKSPDHTLAINERVLVMVFLCAFFIYILMQIASRQVMRRQFVGRFGYFECNMMPNRSFLEFMNMQKSKETMAYEACLTARIRPFRDAELLAISQEIENSEVDFKRHREIPDKVLHRMRYEETSSIHVLSNLSQCSICLLDYKSQDQVVLLQKCKHLFHEECFQMWFNGKSICPIDRNTLVSECQEC